MSDAAAKVSKRRKLNGIWVVPIVAVVIGAGMVVYSYLNEGPEIEVRFSTAKGIEAGKTKIKVRNVEVGLVESVKLGDDLESVIVHAKLEKAAKSLLREDTQFWVVRPRIGAQGVSGIGTLLSGGFVQLSPGSGKVTKDHEFVGLEDPPVTPAGTPGLQFELTTARAGSLSAGDPVLYHGFGVGRIESATFDVETKKMRYVAFIRAPYDKLVTANTRFWNASGVNFSATADGIELDTGSLQSLLVGGVTFGLPEGMPAGGEVNPGTSFELYPDLKSVNAQPYRHAIKYVVRFERSVRGLRPGAPVEYRGIQIGAVEEIMLEEMVATDERPAGNPIPVLIRVEPGRMKLPDSSSGDEELHRRITESVAGGLRASLSLGNILTGSLYVNFDVYRDAEPAEVGTYEGLPTLPTIAGGLEGIEHKVNTLLDKVNALPLEEIAGSAASAMEGLEEIMQSDGMQELPRTLDAAVSELRIVLDSLSPGSALQERLLRTLTEIDRTAASLRSLVQTLDDKPNAVIFSRDAPRDPEPKAGSK
jgi:paraquat-inducible protein B